MGDEEMVTETLEGGPLTDEFMERLELSVRTGNGMINHGIDTKEKFMELTYGAVKTWPNLGQKSWKEIHDIQCYERGEGNTGQVLRCLRAFNRAVENCSAPLLVLANNAGVVSVHIKLR